MHKCKPCNVVVTGPKLGPLKIDPSILKLGKRGNMLDLAELVEAEIAEAIENDSLEEMLEFYMHRTLELDAELLSSLIEARS